MRTVKCIASLGVYKQSSISNQNVNKMQKHIYIFLIIILPILLPAQKFTISGYIEDAASGEKLIAATILEKNSLKGTTTNNFGFYSFTIESGTLELEISYIGYEKKLVTIDLQKNTVKNISLQSSVTLKTIEIVEKRTKDIEDDSQMSKIEVPIEQIKKIPALMGEVDVLKTLQLLPGVQSGVEGQSGLYVRGGSPDQNLILLDGVPIYNVSHLAGIFSVFNADALKTVTLTKGGFPARYGGRLSSVIEINMKDGNMNEFHGEGSIGLISSKLSLEGPIIKGKTSFIVSARRTYWDLLVKPFIAASARDEGVDLSNSLYFYDLNAKINHKINENHRIFASYYSGADIFKTKVTEENDTYGGGIKWGNFVSALRWNYKMTPKLFSNTTLTYSNYDLDINSELEEIRNDNTQKYAARYISGIRDIAAKIDFDYIPSPSHYIKFGASATHHRYKPGAIAIEITENNETLDTILGNEDNFSQEYDLYIEDDMKFGALKANIGLHASGFKVDNEFYKSIQPRISLNYLLNNDLAIKSSFATMSQYLNLLTSEGFSLPTDLWVPSTSEIKPQSSWQAAIGVAKTINKTYEISLEGYYKKMKNVISYNPGENFFSDFGGDTNWEDKITQGDGEAYGAELFIQKKKGKTTGWIGYTLSWNWRQFDNINSGIKYPYKYDRRHDISLVISHEFSDRITASASWIYGTGNSITLPTHKYQRPNFNINSYSNFYNGLGEKNAYRVSDSHRLDISVEFHKKTSWGERSWVIGLYNAYWNKNPFFVRKIVSRESGKTKIKYKEYSILPIIPSIAYNFKF